MNEIKDLVERVAALEQHNHALQENVCALWAEIRRLRTALMCAAAGFLSLSDHDPGSVEPTADTSPAESPADPS